MYWYNFTAKLFFFLKKKKKKEEREAEEEEEEEERIWAGLQMNSPGTLLGGVIPSSCLAFAWVLQNVPVFIKCSGCSRELTGHVTQTPFQEAPPGDLRGATLGKVRSTVPRGGSATPLDKLQPDIFDSWMRWCVKSIICKIGVYPHSSEMEVFENNGGGPEYGTLQIMFPFSVTVRY